MKTNYFFEILDCNVITITYKGKLHQKLNLLLSLPTKFSKDKTKINIDLLIPKNLFVKEVRHDFKPNVQVENFSFSINNKRKKIVYYPASDIKISDKYIEKTFEIFNNKINLEFSESYKDIFEEFLNANKKFGSVYNLVLNEFSEVSKISIRKNLNNNYYVVFTVAGDVNEFFSFLEKHNSISNNIQILSYYKCKELKPKIAFLYDTFFKIDSSFENFKHYLMKQDFTQKFRYCNFLFFDIETENGSFFLNCKELKNNIDNYKLFIEFMNSKFAKIITEKDIDKIELVYQKFSNYLNEINNFLKLLDL